MTVAAATDADAADDMVTLRHRASGAGYGSAPARAVAVTVADTQSAALVVAGAPVTVEENGASPGEFTVALSSEPVAPVTVRVAVPAGTDVRVAPLVVRFTRSDWDQPKTFEVRARDDEDTQPDAVTLALTATGSAEYAALAPAEVEVEVRDDDTPGLKVSVQALQVAEQGSGSFTVALNTRPSGAVSVSVAGVSGTDLTVSGPGNVDLGAGGVLTFTVTDWSAAQRVTVAAGRDDDAADDVATLTLAASGADYAAAPASEVTVTVADDETAALVVSADALEIDEGRVRDFTVGLATRPSAPVTVTVTVPSGVGADIGMQDRVQSAGGGSTVAVVGSVELRFTPEDWEVAQSVRVVASGDDAADGDVTGTLALRAAGAAEYAGLEASVTVTAVDVQKPELHLRKDRLAVGEGPAGAATYRIRLHRAPVGGDVQVSVTGVSGSDLTVIGPGNVDLGAGGVLTFTTDDWSEFRSVRVTAAEDGDAADDEVRLVHRASGADYGSARARTLVVTVDDDETAALEVAGAPVTVQEAGPAVSFRVRLASEPVAPVTVTVTGHAGTDVRVSRTSRRFTPDNWGEYQAFEVTAVDDADALADPEVTLMLAATGSAEYAALAPVEVAVTVEENDTPSLDVSVSELEVAEGRSRRFTVRLNTQPSGDVTVRVTGVAGTDLTVTGPGNVDLGTGGVLTFTDVNWNRAQTLTVAAASDADAADDEETLTLAASGADYGQAPSKAVAVTVDDDDTPALVLSETALAVTEQEPAVSFTVKLASEPTAPVTVTVDGHAGNDLDVTGTALVFHSRNWDEAQTVTVAARHDADSADERVTLSLTAAGAAEYAALAASQVAVTVADNDVPGIRLSATALEVAEDGTTSYRVSLTVQPTGTVTVRVTGMSGTDLTVTGPGDVDLGQSGAGLTFTDTSWDVEQTVTVAAGADADAAADEATLRHRASGADYGSAPARELVVTVADDDTAALEVAGAPVTVQEASPAVSLRVRLASEPVAPVTVTVTGHAGTDVRVSPSSLRFTRGNWGDYQAFEVRAIDDADALADPEVTLALAATGSAEYAALAPVEVAVTVEENDTPSLDVSVSELEVAEGRSRRFTVRLNTQPSDDVTVRVTGVSGTDLTVTGPANVDLGTGGVLTFTDVNWNRAQTLTVAAASDADAADDEETLTLAASGADYGQAPSKAVAVTVADDDTPALVLSKTALAVTEQEPAVSFTVKLASEPTAPVTVTVDGHAGNDLDVTGTALAFHSGNWDEAQTVTVAALEDSDANDERVTLELTAAGAAEYAALAASQVAVTVTDNDVPGIRLSATALEVAEGGTTSYRVSLTVQPTGTVTVRVTGMSGTDLTVTGPGNVDLGTGGVLSFTDTSWDVEQTVTVAAGADADAAADEATLRHRASGADYGSAPARELVVTVADDDTAALVLSATALVVQELGPAVSLRVRLASEPLAPVTVTVTGHAGTDVRVSPSSLRFTRGNWGDYQAFEVRAIDDADALADPEVTLALAATGSAEYAALVPVKVAVTVEENDTPSLDVSATQLKMSEGGSRRFTVRLNTQPSGDVTVRVTGVAGTDLTVTGPGNADLGAGGVLTFTDVNWNRAQTVTVAAAADADAAADEETLTLAASGADYGQAPSKAVAVTVADEDTPRLVLSKNAREGLTVQEGGNPARSFTVKLASEPTAPVLVRVAGAAGSTLRSDPPAFFFTDEDWDAPQSVDVQAGDDGNATHDETALLLTPEGAPEYEALDQVRVAVTVEDDELPGIRLFPARLSVDEGERSHYGVSLTTQPVGEVQVRVTGMAGTDLTATIVDGRDLASGGVLVFTPGNWDKRQWVEVEAAEDADADDDIVTLAMTAGGGYPAPPQELVVTVTDVTPPNTAPTASNSVVETVENTDYTFAADDFEYDDADGDALASVKVTSLPGKGTLKYDGTALTASDLPQTVPATELDEGKLVYDPPSTGSGEPYTVFQFKVNDGAADSTAAAFMNIDVTTPDCTGVSAVTCRIAVGGSVMGNIDPGNDVDFWKVPLMEGRTYQFDAKGADTNDGTQPDPKLLLYDDSNFRNLIGEDDDGGTDRNARLTYTVPTGNGGTYFLQVESANIDAGTYTLTVTDVTPQTQQEAPPAPPSTPLTAEFRNVPAEHDGSSAFTFELHFSEAPKGLSYRTLRGNAFFDVSNGTVTKAKRLVKKDNSGWLVTVEPASDADVMIGFLPALPADDCTEAAVVCTADGTRLSVGAATFVPGPASLSVADAAVQEGPNATLDFVVTLSRARHEATTVDYATSDGTATAGADYTADSGTLSFASGETGKTVSVDVLDDSHDEGSETLTFTLSNPVPAATAKLGDATATGTIDEQRPDAAGVAGALRAHGGGPRAGRSGRTDEDAALGGRERHARGPGAAGHELLRRRRGQAARGRGDARGGGPREDGGGLAERGEP